MKHLKHLLVAGAVTALVLLALSLAWHPAAISPEQHALGEPVLTPAEPPDNSPALDPQGNPRARNAGEIAVPPAQRNQQESKAALPFFVGEHFDYRIRWSYFPAAASVEMKVVEQRPFYGRKAWHFQALASTLSPVRSLYELDDQFDSYSDVATLRSYQFEMHLREQGKQQKRIVQLLRAKDAPRPDDAAVYVPDETRDALSLLYYLRTVDWQRTPELRVPVYDGRTLYDVHARREGTAANIEVPAGNYHAERISLRVYREGREVPSTHFQLWLANDAARTPVLIEAELPFGTLRVELQPRDGH
jgi:hypothetical protein